MYSLLVIFLALTIELPSMSTTRKKILDNMKNEISASIFDSSSCDFEVINNTVKEHDKKLEELQKEANNLQNQVNALK